jgi:hypothetical protein
MDVGMAEAGQSCDEPLHREEEGRPHQDVLAETWPMGISPFADGTLILMDRTSPWLVGRFLEHVAACWASWARVAGCRSPRRGNVLLSG